MVTQDMRSWLVEHLYYELKMLRFCLDQISKPHAQADWNAFLESFAVHARNIHSFLTGREHPTAYRAHEFGADNAKSTQEIDRLIGRANAQVVHMGRKREIDPDQKLRLEDAIKIAEWIETELPKFHAKLPSGCKGYWARGETAWSLSILPSEPGRTTESRTSLTLRVSQDSRPTATNHAEVSSTMSHGTREAKPPDS